MVRLLNVDPRVRRLCLVKEGEGGYPRSVLSRFTKKVGAHRFWRIREEKVVKLLKNNNDAREVDAVLDVSFIKAWSTRDPKNSREGYSDKEARVGRTGRTYGLGYKLHLSVDFERKLPLASMVAPANQKRNVKGLLRVDKNSEPMGHHPRKRNTICDLQSKPSTAS